MPTFKYDTFKLYITDKPSMTNMVQQLCTKTEETDKHGNTTVKLSPMSKRRNFLKMWLSKDFPLLAKIGVKLLSMHTTTCAAERDWVGSVLSK